MKSRDFIKEKLDTLVREFPYVKAVYEFDDFDNSHFIQIFPSSVYQNNLSYVAFETAVISEFIKLFPYENIAFVSEGSIFEVENPDFVIKGNLYDMQFSMDLGGVRGVSKVNVFNEPINVAAEYTNLENASIEVLPSHYYFAA